MRGSPAVVTLPRTSRRHAIPPPWCARSARSRIAVALAISVGLAAGCGGGGGGGEDLAQGLTPAELLQQSADAFAEVESFRIGLEATG